LRAGTRYADGVKKGEVLRTVTVTHPAREAEK